MAHKPKQSHEESYALQVGDRGRVVLPARVRERLKLNRGDRLVLILNESGEMRLVSLNRQLDKCMGMFADREPHRIASEELIAERREEARREELD